jgi:hypothetical protein
MKFWKILSQIINFIIPTWLFHFLQKYPWVPLLIVTMVYMINNLF